MNQQNNFDLNFLIYDKLNIYDKALEILCTNELNS